MKVALMLGVALFAAGAQAQSGLDAQCPNASATLNSVAFPLDLPAATKTGEAVVEFTIAPEGSIVDATATSSSDPAFAAPAVAAVRKLTCKQRTQPQRYALPISFAKPETLSESMCPNLRSVTRGWQLPQSLLRNGIRRGDAIVEFTLQPSGDVTDFVVLRTSSPEFAAVAVHALEELKCNASPGPRQVRYPVSFRID